MSKTVSFEESMDKLRAIVEALEEGACGLDESMQLFEEGIGLANECQNKLENAEQKITELSARSRPEASE